MNSVVQPRKADLLTDASKTQIDAWLKKYPDDRKQSAVLSALQAAQQQNGGWVTRELMDAEEGFGRGLRRGVLGDLQDTVVGDEPGLRPTAASAPAHPSVP